MQNTLERAETTREIQPKARPRAAQQVRARQAVLGGIVLFVLVQAGLRGWIERDHPELRDPTFEIKYRQWVRLKAVVPQPPATVLFMGSSMTAQGIKADMVDQPLSAALGRSVIGFNLGANSGGPFTQLVCLRRLLQRGAKPDLVVLELSSLFYEYQETPQDLPQFAAPLLGRGDLNTVARYSTNADELRHEWWQSFLVPVHGNRLTILNQSAQIFVPYKDRLELWDDMDSHGWRRMETPLPQEHGMILKGVKQEFGPRLAEFKVGPAPVRALRELTELLMQERIPAVLVSMPQGPLMRSLHAPGLLEPLEREFASLSRKSGFPLVDARTWLGEEKFRDSFHLTGEGAEAFTERLVREHLLPWMGSRCATELAKK